MNDLLKDLNAAQRQAVTHGEGPLLILAGAGTGKTRVLTHRILHLIESGKAKPEEILALTFTDKATVEMQERLDILLPYGYTEIWVKTFHGFCDSVLKERAHEIGLDPGYRLLTQTDVSLFLREHLFDLELDHYRPLGNPLRFVRFLADHFGHLRDELVSVERYREYAEQLEESAMEEADRETAQKTIELARAYGHYDRLLKEKGVVDFASLQSFTLELFARRPSVLKETQERFKYVLVDEFQDTNSAQNRLVEQLVARHGNLLVVGDDDQSIYKWRGASLSNILNFETQFPTAQKVLLTENYRSTQPVLDMSYAVIQNNNPHRLEAREGLNKRIVSKVSNTEAVNPHAIHFEHYLQEVQFVVEQIQRHVNAGRGVSYRDHAVLVRATAHAFPFVDELNRAGIPCHFSGTQGLYQREEVKDLMSLIRALANPYDDIALFRLLSLPVFSVEMEYLLSLLQKARERSIPLIQALEQSLQTPDLFSLLGTGTPMAALLELFRQLQALAKTEPVSHLLGTFLKESGYLHALEESEAPDTAEKLQNIATFSQLIKSFEETHPEGRLLDCLDALQSRQDMGDRLAPAEEASDTDTVKVFTIHAAKGLEFDTVFLVNLVQHRFPSTNRKDPFELPEPLLAEPLQGQDQSSSHLCEERRLFYVAATRAKNHLFLTHSDYYDGKKRWKPSQFIQEAMDSGMVDVTDQGSKLLNVSLGAPVAATHEPGDKPVVFTQELQHRSLKLSYSKIQTFQMCPLKYRFRYLYQLAEPLSHAASFGSSLHNTLNAFYQELKKSTAPSLDRLQELYDTHWIPLGYLSSTHHHARKEEGWTILDRFYRSQGTNWVMPHYLECPFTLKLPSGLTVSGRIDRIDRLPDGTYEVIDYKTGEFKESMALHNDLQLSIYALACEQVLKLPVSKLSLHYLKENQKISTTRDADQMEKTIGDLEEIGQTFLTSNFEATPSPFICGICEYRLLCDQAAV